MKIKDGGQQKVILFEYQKSSNTQGSEHVCLTPLIFISYPLSEVWLSLISRFASCYDVVRL